MKSLLRAMLIAALIPAITQAASPAFDEINKDDMKDITKGMGANFVHNSMMGASKLGTLFGFQVGVVGAQTSVPKINDLAKEQGGELKNLYNAGVMAAVGIPFGISFEATMMPTLKSNQAKMSAQSFGLKMNFNEIIPILPINVALRGVYSTAKMSFNQTIGSTPGKVENETKTSGVQLLISPMIPLVEPYVGVGMLNAENELTASATGVFDSTYSTGTTKKESVSGTQLLAGVEVNLVLLKLGVEYSKAFDNSRIGAKLSFGF